MTLSERAWVVIVLVVFSGGILLGARIADAGRPQYLILPSTATTSTSTSTTVTP